VPAEQLAPAELTGLLGYAVIGAEGTELGRIVDLLVDTQGRVRAVVVDVGGFMGVGNRKVAVAWSALRFAAGDKGPVISILIPPDRIKSWADYIVGRPIAILGTSSTGQ
jgi:sporulation protein YlmC with PRC-barrel domain